MLVKNSLSGYSFLRSLTKYNIFSYVRVNNLLILVVFGETFSKVWNNRKVKEINSLLFFNFNTVLSLFFDVIKSSQHTSLILIKQHAKKILSYHYKFTFDCCGITHFIQHVNCGERK